MEKSKQRAYLILIFLIVLDILLLAYVFFYPADSSLKYAVEAFDFVICIFLWVEFIYSYQHADNRKQYLRSNSLSILGMLPLNLFFLRALRLLKLIQFVKLYIILKDRERAFSQFLKKTFLDKILIITIIFVFAVTVLITKLDSDINNIHTAVWYVVVSMTSTGYGDVVPQTVTGKIIGMIAMIGGILIFATLTAVISSLYVSKISNENHDNLNSKIDELTSEIEKLNEKIDELKK